MGLNLAEKISLKDILGSAVTTREWNMNGLPSDDFSVDNALMIYNSRRWPLMIDPQEQANKWLKKQEAARKIKILKTNEDNFIRNLENCIQFGSPVLIEGLGEEINVALNPVLLKQTYKKGPTTYLRMG
jgi:dynein heavy chain, axonemal